MFLCFSVSLFICLFVYLFIWLFFYLIIFLFVISLFAYIIIYLFIYLFIYSCNNLFFMLAHPDFFFIRNSPFLSISMKINLVCTKFKKKIHKINELWKTRIWRIIFSSVSLLQSGSKVHREHHRIKYEVPSHGFWS